MFNELALQGHLSCTSLLHFSWLIYKPQPDLYIIRRIQCFTYIGCHILAQRYIYPEKKKNGGGEGGGGCVGGYEGLCQTLAWHATHQSYPSRLSLIIMLFLDIHIIVQQFNYIVKYASCSNLITWLSMHLYTKA